MIDDRFDEIYFDMPGVGFALEFIDWEVSHSSRAFKNEGQHALGKKKKCTPLRESYFPLSSPMFELAVS